MSWALRAWVNKRKKKHWHNNHNVSRTSRCIKWLTQSIDHGERGRMVRGWPQVAEWWEHTARLTCARRENQYHAIWLMRTLMHVDSWPTYRVTGREAGSSSSLASTGDVSAESEGGREWREKRDEDGETSYLTLWCIMHLLRSSV